MAASYSMDPQVTLICGDREFNVSKSLLAESSPYFSALLCGNFIEGHSNCIELKDVDSWEMEAILALVDCRSGSNHLSALPFEKKIRLLLTCDMLLFEKGVDICKKAIFRHSNEMGFSEIELVWEVGEFLRSPFLLDMVIESAVYTYYKESVFPQMFSALRWNSILLTYVRNSITLNYQLAHTNTCQYYWELVTPVNFLLLWVKQQPETRILNFSYEINIIANGSFPNMYMESLRLQNDFEQLKAIFESGVSESMERGSEEEKSSGNDEESELSSELIDLELEDSISDGESSAMDDSISCECTIGAFVWADSLSHTLMPALFEINGAGLPHVYFLGFDGLLEDINESTKWQVLLEDHQLFAVYNNDQKIILIEFNFTFGIWKQISHFTAKNIQPVGIAKIESNIYVCVVSPLQEAEEKVKILQRDVCRILSYSLSENEWEVIDQLFGNEDDELKQSSINLLKIHNNLYSVFYVYNVNRKQKTTYSIISKPNKSLKQSSLKLTKSLTQHIGRKSGKKKSGILTETISAVDGSLESQLIEAVLQDLNKDPVTSPHKVLVFHLDLVKKQFLEILKIQNDNGKRIVQNAEYFKQNQSDPLSLIDVIITIQKHSHLKLDEVI